MFLLSGCSDRPALEPLSADAVVLAFGDSLTYGTGSSPDKSYPALLEKKLQRKVINAGVPGETSRRGLQRLPALLERYQPELVIICHGGNDILRRLDPVQTENNLRRMIALARHNGAQVVLLAVPEFSLFLEPAPFYTRLAEQNRVPLLENSLSEILSSNRLKSDRVHPNAEGYRQLADDIYRLLRTASRNTI